MGAPETLEKPKKPSLRRELAYSIPMPALRYITMELFASRTGLTVDAVRRRREIGDWNFFVTLDGNVYVDVDGYYAYMQEHGIHG